jgi:hypothetical protein
MPDWKMFQDLMCRRKNRPEPIGICNPYAKLLVLYKSLLLSSPYLFKLLRLRRSFVLFWQTAIAAATRGLACKPKGLLQVRPATLLRVEKVCHGGAFCLGGGRGLPALGFWRSQLVVERIGPVELSLVLKLGQGQRRPRKRPSDLIDLPLLGQLGQELRTLALLLLALGGKVGPPLAIAAID